MSCSLCRKSCSLCGKIYSLCKKSFAERVRNFRVPFSRDFKVSLKHCFLLQQEGVRGPLRHRCQDHAHQQPSVKREVILKKSQFYGSLMVHYPLYRRGSMKAPHTMTKLLPPIFLFHFFPWLRIFIKKKFSTFFFTSGNFWTPQHPLWWKYWKIVQIRFLIAQKKRLGALNATQKTSAPNKVRCLTKSRKTSKNYHFLPFWEKNGNFFRFFLDFFRNHTLLGAEVFCVAFSASRRFFWAIKKTSFGQFFKLFIIKAVGGVLKLPDMEKKGHKKLLKKILNQGA